MGTMPASKVWQEEDKNPTSNFIRGIITSLHFPQNAPVPSHIPPLKLALLRDSSSCFYQQQKTSQLLLLLLLLQTILRSK